MQQKYLALSCFNSFTPGFYNLNFKLLKIVKKELLAAFITFPSTLPSTARKTFT